jgi:hypothetical protein
MSEKISAQKIKKEFTTPLELAQKYYSILLTLNNIPFTKRQLQVLSYTAIRGTISSSSAKDDFIKTFGSSIDSINNVISELHKHKLLVKINGKNKVNPKIALDFSNKNYVIQLNLKIREENGFSEGMVEQSNR